MEYFNEIVDRMSDEITDRMKEEEYLRMEEKHDLKIVEMQRKLANLRSFNNKPERTKLMKDLTEEDKEKLRSDPEILDFYNCWNKLFE